MSDDYKRLASERFTGTKIHDYDQITAISQNAINRQIQLMHKKAPRDSPLRRFTTSTSKDDDYTQIVDAELDPSEVELLLQTDEKQTVHFILKLKSGRFNYLSLSGRTSVEKSATIKDWRIVSRVRLKVLALDPAKVPEFVRKSLTNPNDYSIHQLFIDFTTVEIPTYDATLGVLDDDEAREDFHKHIKMYFDKLKAEDNGSHSTIHYLPILKKFDNHSPPFAPTSFNFQNFPFVSASDEGPKKGENNTLVYVQMTQGRKLPLDLLPFPTANWIVPTTPRYDGTLCLSKATFMDKWLLPQLAPLNNATTWVTVIDAPSYSLRNGHFGYENASQTPWTYDSENSDATVLKYSYTHTMTETKESVKKFVQQRCNVWNELEIPIGLDANDQCVIKLGGRTEIWTWITKPAWIFNVFRWNAELVLKGVDDGKLTVEVKNVKVDVGSQQGYFWVEESAKQQLQEILDDVQSHIKTKESEISNTMTHAKKEVEQLFGKPWTFVLRGNNDFVIKKAAFNSEGDLLAQLNYRLED